MSSKKKNNLASNLTKCDFSCLSRKKWKRAERYAIENDVAVEVKVGRGADKLKLSSVSCIEWYNRKYTTQVIAI